MGFFLSQRPVKSVTAPPPLALLGPAPDLYPKPKRRRRAP